MRRFALLATVGCGLFMASPAMATDPVQLTSFDNFTLDAIYGSWGAPFATLTSGSTGYTINSHEYGSGYKYLGGEFDANGNTLVQLTVNVSQGVAGCLVDLNDANNNGQAYRFYGLVPGGGIDGGNEYVLTMPITDGLYFSGTGVLDTTRISQMNIEIDPGPGHDFYTATFEDLSLVSPAAVQVPEPASLGVCSLAAVFLGRRRR